MENLYIQGTPTLPTVSLNTDGTIKIEGRALLEDAFKFFQPIHTWLKEFSHDELNIDINLEYYNTSVSKQLHDLLKIIESNPNNKKINLKWNYEEGDDEMLEAGEIYAEMFRRINFDFIQFEEALE